VCVCRVSTSWLVFMWLSLFVVFFFSSRRRHTRLVSDWSSDVCSSDLRRDERTRHDREVEYRVRPSRHRREPLQRTESRERRGSEIGRASCRERGEISEGGG